MELPQMIAKHLIQWIEHSTFENWRQTGTSVAGLSKVNRQTQTWPLMEAIV